MIVEKPLIVLHVKEGATNIKSPPWTIAYHAITVQQMRLPDYTTLVARRVRDAILQWHWMKNAEFEEKNAEDEVLRRLTEQSRKYKDQSEAEMRKIFQVASVSRQRLGMPGIANIVQCTEEWAIPPRDGSGTGRSLIPSLLLLRTQS